MKAALKNFYSTVILNEISEQVQKENLDANRFLLSDTQQLLKEIIGEEDTPSSSKRPERFWNTS